MTNFINWDAISAKARESTKIPSQQLPSLHVFLMQYRRKLLFKQHYLWWFRKHDVTSSIAAVCYVNGKTYEIKIGFCIESRSEEKIEFTHSTCIKIHSMILNYVDDDDITTMMGKKKVKYDFDVIFKLSMAFFERKCYLNFINSFFLRLESQFRSFFQWHFAYISKLHAHLAMNE